MTPQFENFYTSWLGKANSYTEDSLTNCFDKFITLFIIYNFLYMEVRKKLIDSGVCGRKRHYDKTAATDYVVAYLKGKFFVEQVLNDEISKQHLSTICSIIKEKQFAICHDEKGIHLSYKDDELLNSLYAKEAQKQATAILTLIYHVRCNLFHGSKGFEDVQRQLLVPIIYLLEKIIKITYNKLIN
jgi:hypothetical protein